MKIKLSNTVSTLTLCAAIPLFLGTGCGNNNDKTNGSSASGSNTNSSGINSSGNSPGMNSSPATNSRGMNSQATNADNSAINARDTNSAMLTPGDQGGSDTDRKLTQQIRQQVVSGTNNYSLDARNIKIITVNGKVTLRGPVDSDMEKSGIDGIAKTAAGDGNVDDQLEVKANSNQQITTQ